MDKTIDENLRNEIIDDLGIAELTSFEQEAIINDLEDKRKILNQKIEAQDKREKILDKIENDLKGGKKNGERKS